MVAMLSIASPVSADMWQELVDADRALAANAAKDELRAAFLPVLDEDGISFDPGPESARQVWTERAPRRERLEWRPAQAEVSISGDLGYVLAPWRYTRLPAAAALAPDESPGQQDKKPGSTGIGEEEEKVADAAEKPSAYGHLLNIWRRAPGGEWKLLVSHSIRHAEIPLPAETIRRGSLFAGEAPVWPVGMPELRKADLEPAGSVRPELVAADFIRLRDGRLPEDGLFAEPFDQGAPRHLATGMVISGAGDLAVTWGGAANAVRWLRVWRRPVAGDPPGLGWRLAVDLSQAAQKAIKP